MNQGNNNNTKNPYQLTSDVDLDNMEDNTNPDINNTDNLNKYGHDENDYTEYAVPPPGGVNGQNIVTLVQMNSLEPLSDNNEEVQDTEDEDGEEDEEMKFDVEIETKGKELPAHDKYTSIAL